MQDDTIVDVCQSSRPYQVSVMLRISYGGLQGS
jgi:hypothetical protein